MNENFTTSFTVDQTPEQVFAAINNVGAWWSGDPGVKGNADKLGAEFTYQHLDIHYSSHKVTELVPGKKIVWHTTDSRINFVEGKSEWTGTDIVFQIAEKDGKTELRFTHVGLIPAIACYTDCSVMWNWLINDNLRGLIIKG